MSSLRDLLEAKARKRTAVPIQVSDASLDHETWMGIYAAMQAAKARNDDDAIRILVQQLSEAEAQFRSHWAAVELQALPSDDWEEASRAWATDGNSGDGINWSEALAPLLAASCVEPSLQDADWWSDQLAKPSWTEGDRDLLKLALLRLNVTALEPNIPKG